MRLIVFLVATVFAVGRAVSMTVEEAKSFMNESRAQFLDAQSYQIEYTTMANGVSSKSRCWIKRDVKKGASVLNESQTMLLGFSMPKVTQLVIEGKLYLISAIVPGKVLHLKFADGQLPDDVFCNFFTAQGKVVPISDSGDKCVIKFTPSAAELAQINQQSTAVGGEMLGLGVGNIAPTSFRYTFLKTSKNISKIVGYNGQGDEVLKISISKLELNAKIDDSSFTLPNGYKVIDLQTAADVAKIFAGGLMPKKP